MASIETTKNIVKPAIKFLEVLRPLLDIGIRLYVANVFFFSGLLKTDSWWKTLSQFERDFHVPLLSPEVAAYLGTGAELILPVFLVLGLGGRAAAIGLFIFNAVAIISFPELAGTGLTLHHLWGLLLLVTLIHGPGKLSIDHFIRKKYMGDV
ncbi:MAG TPA: DoxX family protein [Acidiferrobacteraceae bacterium]|nr:DoxX family protein [Acidiferrobacteraceae bacterium]